MTDFSEETLARYRYWATEKLLQALQESERAKYKDEDLKAISAILLSAGIDPSTGKKTKSIPHGVGGPPEVDRPRAVVVSDVGMPFGSMVIFMVKWALADTPDN